VHFLPEPAPRAALVPAQSTDPEVHLRLAETRRREGDELAALAHLIAAQTLQARAGPPLELLNVATGYFMKGDHATAQGWYELALHLEPGLAAAHLNLAAIHAQRGDAAAAQASRDRAYAIQRVFAEPVPDPARQLLVLCAGRGASNVPFESLLAGGRSSRIKYAIDCATVAEDALLPPFDLVFNAVGDADIAPALATRLANFAAGCRQPLMNRPEAVQTTRRDRLAALLTGLDGVVLAPCSRHLRAAASRTALRARLARARIGWPVLARPVASHGGAGLVRCDDMAALEAAISGIDGPHYLTGYVDSCSADAHFRKYRMVFVGGEPLPYHLAISPHWMVHYFSAGMPGQAWKLDEERRFLDDPRKALGPVATAAIAAIGQRLELDYAGVDFALLPDGRVLVFEANATMLVHTERPGGPLAHRNAAVSQIALAFERLQGRRQVGG
jgi:glutathione synthase/RimK-type ligase-like ATP-grasp enzyme